MSWELYLLASSIPLIAISYYGWGAFLGEITVRPSRQDAVPWYTPVIGSAFLTIVGGLLASLGAFIPGVAIPVVLAGTAFGLLRLGRQGARWNWGVCVAMLAVILFAVMASLNRFEKNDDLLAYLPLARDLLAQGTIYQPFSLRVGLNPNGQAVQSAFWLALGGVGTLSFYDAVPLYFSLLLWAARAPSGEVIYRVSIGICFVVAPYMAWNTAPSIWIVGAFAAIFGISQETHARYVPLVLGLILTAGFALRSYWLLPLAGFVLIMVFQNRKDTALYLRTVASTAILSILFVIPYLWMTFVQFKTPCALLFHGTLHPDMATFSTGSTFQVLWELSGKLEFFLPFFLLILTLVLQRQFAVLVMILVVFLLGVHHGNALSWHYVFRYLSGILYGGLFFGLVNLHQTQKQAFLLPLVLIAPIGFENLQGKQPPAFHLGSPYVHQWIGESQGVAAAQAAIEEGSVVLTFVAHPGSHDFSRNKVLLGDIAGALAGEDWTTWSDLEAFAREHGIAHVMFSDPDVPESEPRYAEKFERYAQMMPPFYQARWNDHQRKLMGIARECIDRQLGTRFANTYVVALDQ